MQLLAITVQSTHGTGGRALLTLIKGQISFGGMQDVLEAITRHANTTNGVLRITSNEASGLMGVFCGRFITGAVLVLNGDNGYGAVKRLLSAKDGTYAFMDAEGESFPELKQSLGIDITMLLANVDFDKAELRLSEESLTGMRASGDQIVLIDTDLQLNNELISQEESLDRITRTYDRIMSLSEHIRGQTGSTVKPEVAERPDDATRTPTAPIPHPFSNMPQKEKEELPHADQDFKRLKGWSMSGKKTLGGVVLAVIIAAIAYALVTFAPKLIGH